jgi:hypothetical protein
VIRGTKAGYRETYRSGGASELFFSCVVYTSGQRGGHKLNGYVCIIRTLISVSMVEKSVD